MCFRQVYASSDDPELSSVRSGAVRGGVCVVCEEWGCEGCVCSVRSGAVRACVWHEEWGCEGGV